MSAMAPLAFRPVWFDSMGAKSMCVVVEACGKRVLIDPGAAVMHPGFPAPEEAKEAWFEEAVRRVSEQLRSADVVVLTHYHYDHYYRLDLRLYEGKLLVAKDPNAYINDSQRGRAEEFYSRLYRELAGVELEEVAEEPGEEEYPDPLADLEEAMGRSYGDYEGRRRELLRRGMEWFKARAEAWRRRKRIPELRSGGLRVVFADGRVLDLDGLRLRFTKPMFHGVEFSRVGWVVGLTVECGGRRLVFTSDVNGPIIEDYARWVVDERPDAVVLDGPMTYMLGYTLNLVNFRRALGNALRIVEESGAELVVYDHHLPREPKFRERTAEVWKRAEALGVRVVTAAELLGTQPAVLRYAGRPGRSRT